MGQQLDTSLIGVLWTVLTAVVVGLFSLGVFRAKVATKSDLERVQDGHTTLLRKSLYREDGTSVYVPRIECDKTQTGCSARIIAKLDEMKAESQRRHEEYLEAQRDHLRMHDGLPEFMGKVKQFMHHRLGD